MKKIYTKPSIKSLLLTFLLFVLFNSYSQTVPPANFAFPIGSGTNNSQYGYSSVKDASGNFYVTGVFQGTADFNPSPTVTNNLTSSGGTVTSATDFFVAKYSSTGVYLWAFSIGSGSTINNNNYSVSLVLDNANNFYITGFFTGTADFNPSSTITNNLVSNGGNDAFLAKYNSSGNYLWAISMGSTGADLGQRIIYDTVSNNVYVAGVFSVTVDFDPSAATQNLTSLGNYDVFMSAYSSTGTYQWAKSFGGSGQDVVNGFVMDANRNMYLNGYFTGTVDFDPSSTVAQNVISNGGNDIFMAKYDLNGNYKWAYGIGTSNADQGMALTLDNNGYLVMAAYAGGLASSTIDLDPSANVANKTFAVTTSREGVIAKYDTASCSYQWGILCTGITNHLIQPYGIAVDAGNNILVTGFCTTTSIFNPSNPTGSTIVSLSANNGFVVKYNPDGSFQWVFDFPGYFSYPQWITYDAGTASFLLTGGFQTNTTYPTIDFNPTSGSLPLSSNNNSINVFVASYKDNKTWTGGSGTWSTSANWNPSGVPTLYDNIIIPSGSPNVSGTVSASSIILNGTASLTIPTSATLEIGGNILNTTATAITAIAGGITAKGLFNQNFSSNTFTSNIIKNLTVDNSYGLSINNKFSVTGNLTINSADTLTINDTLQIGGTIINSGKLNSTLGTIEFNGTSAQTIPANTFNNNLVKNLIINNSNGITINSDDTVTNMLTFVSGKIKTLNNKVVLLNGSSISGASSTKYINGNLRKVGNQAFTFPIGDSIKYAPISISAPALNTDYFTANYVWANPNTIYSTSSLESSLNRVSGLEYWMLNRNGSSNVDVTLSWDSIRSGGIANLSELRVANWNGTQWLNQGNTATAGSIKIGTVKSNTGVSTFGAFTLGSTTATNTLPVVLKSFYVEKQNTSVVLKWTTVSEINNNYFEIQKSKDGNNFIAIGNIESKGNSSLTINYSFTDLKPNEGMNYYRLKQVDKNGKTNFSEIRKIDFSSKLSSINIYPNPIIDEKLNVDLGENINESIDYSISDLQGKIVKRGVIVNRQQTISVNELLQGTYVLKVGNSFSKIILKK